MGAVYITLLVGDSKFEIDVYYSFLGASHKALEIAAAENLLHLVGEPKEEKIDAGVVWTYVNTDSAYLAVIFQNIQHLDSFAAKEEPTLPCPIPSGCFITDGYSSGNLPAISKCFTKDGYQILQSPILQSPIISDDPAHRDLPGGWNRNGKPVTMASVIDDPGFIKPYNELYNAQLKALVTARIRKRPRFSMLVSGVGTFLQKEALNEIKDGTVIGDRIIDQEYEWLCDFLDEQY